MNTNIESLKLANSLRKEDIKVLIEMNNRKLKKVFESADKNNVPYVIVLGENEVNEGTIEIKDFCEDRSDNFDKADIALAKIHGCMPGEVKKWRKEHGYTWHECRDMKTMQKVPSIIHNNISHSGGISQAKKGV